MLALITATLNSDTTLPKALVSVCDLKQATKHFFVDGGSTDDTLKQLRAYASAYSGKIILEQRGRGLYQAINQGVGAAMDDPDVTHIGMLHSDDYLIANAFERYLTVIETDPSPVFYSDIEFHNTAGTRVRVWESAEFSRFKLHTGWMPPHTSIIVSKDVYQKLGLYNPDFGTAADYEWIVRVLSEYGEKSRYFPEKTLSMLVGGASSSSLKARLRANAMDGKVWADKSSLQSSLVRVCKPLRKVSQFKLF